MNIKIGSAKILFVLMLTLPTPLVLAQANKLPQLNGPGYKPLPSPTAVSKVPALQDSSGPVKPLKEFKKYESPKLLTAPALESATAESTSDDKTPEMLAEEQDEAESTPTPTPTP